MSDPENTIELATPAVIGPGISEEHKLLTNTDGLLPGDSPPLAGSSLATTEADLVSVPGLIGQLQLGRQLGYATTDPRIAQFVSEQAVIEFGAAHGLQDAAIDALLSGEKRYEALIEEGLLDKLWLLLTGLRLEAETALVDVTLPVAELHCPHLPGCETSLEYSARRKEGLTLKLAVVRQGVGGGYIKEISLNEAITTAGACLSIAKRAQVSLCEYRSHDDVIVLYYIRINQMFDDLEVAAIEDPAHHLCAADFHDRRERVTHPALDEHRLEPIVCSLESPLSSVSARSDMRTGRLMEASIDPTAAGERTRGRFCKPRTHVGACHGYRVHIHARWPGKLPRVLPRTQSCDVSLVVAAAWVRLPRR